MVTRSLISRTIEFLRFPMIIGILFIHNNLFHFNILAVNEANVLVRSVIYFFSNTLGSLCVPLFFFISGYLFFINLGHTVFTRDIYLSKLKKRVYTLLIPYVFWNFITLCVYSVLGEYSFSISSFLSAFWEYNDGGGSIRYTPIDGPLWFIRDLMLVSVMSPLIYWLIKRLGMIPIIILFVGWILSDNYYTKLFALSFFSFGAYFSIKKIDIITFLKSNRIIPLVFLLLMGVVTFMDTMSINMYYLYDFYIIIGILGVIYWASQFVDEQSISNCRFFVSASFLIYVAHTLIEGKIRQFLVLLCGADNTITLLLVYFIPVILSTVVLMGVYYIIKRYFSWGLFCLGGR